jgi:hypothetical protein
MPQKKVPGKASENQTVKEILLKSGNSCRLDTNESKSLNASGNFGTLDG